MLRWLAPVSRSQAAQRDTAAFASVYERHHRVLYRYCRSILRDGEMEEGEDQADAVAPNAQQACPVSFGNSDIFGWSSVSAP